MKKLLALTLALVMSLSLVACGGGVDKTEVSAAYTSVSTAYNEVANLANENADAISQETVSALTETGSVIPEYKAEIESSDLTQERADEIVEELAAYPDQIAALKAQVEAEIGEGGGSGSSDAGDTFSLWDMPQAETPDLSGTTWTFAGGYINGVEMTQEDMDASLQAYGGVLQFTFDADGAAHMVQGGGTLDGTYEYRDDGGVGVAFDNNGSELRYGCIFTGTDQVAMIAIADEAGANGIYLVQQ